MRIIQGDGYFAKSKELRNGAVEIGHDAPGAGMNIGGPIFEVKPHVRQPYQGHRAYPKSSNDPFKSRQLLGNAEQTSCTDWADWHGKTPLHYNSTIPEDPSLKDINDSGYPQQIAVGGAVNEQPSAHGWTVRYSEHHWSSPMDSRTGCADLVQLWPPGSVKEWLRA
jgi:hypothetical protein